MNELLSTISIMSFISIFGLLYIFYNTTVGNSFLLENKDKKYFIIGFLIFILSLVSLFINNETVNLILQYFIFGLFFIYSFIIMNLVIWVINYKRDDLLTNLNKVRENIEQIRDKINN